jgi:peptidoglycan/xylan/chitin deacetylase (PgdA/CDA1 family)
MIGHGHADRGSAVDPLESPGRLSLGRVPMILMYHGVAEVAEDPNLLHVSPSRFAEQMAWLQRLGLRGVAIGTLLDAMRAGRPRGLIGITFDDGYASVLEAAIPELLRRRFTASVFVVSDRLGGTSEWDEKAAWPLLSAPQVAELAAAGMEIGSHGATHVRLADLDAGELQAEVSGSRTQLSQLTGVPVRGFAYPYGSMDTSARHAVRQAGYEYACAVRTPLGDLGLMALPRVYVGQRDGAVRLTVKRVLYRGYVAVKGRRP